MDNIRLLVIVNNFPPDYAGGASIFGDMCHGLAEQGFDVTVRCAYPYYPEWEDKSGRNGWKIWRYRDEEITVERYGLYIPANPRSLLQRLVHEASFFFSLQRGLFGIRRYDMVMAYYPAVTCTASAVMGKLLFRKPLWLNVQDLAAEAAADVGLVRSGFVSRFFRAIQAWMFNRADVWSTIYPTMAEKMVPVRKHGQPLLMIPNWLNASLAQELNKPQADSSSSHPGSPARLLYSGNIGIKQNLLDLLRTFAASEDDFHFKVHGNGAGAREVEAWIRNNGDSRFAFGPLLEEKDFALALHETDYFVITEAPSGASFMPSKLVTGIASGTPILAVSNPDSPLGREMIGYGLGPHFTWEQLQSIPDVILRVPITDGGRYGSWLDNVRLRYGNYDRDRLIKRFADNLRRLYKSETILSDY